MALIPINTGSGNDKKIKARRTLQFEYQYKLWRNLLVESGGVTIVSLKTQITLTVFSESS